MISLRFFLHLGLLLVTSSGFAQTACPQGVAPGSPQCGPAGGGMLSNGASPRRRPTAAWKTTWGAYAEGSIKGIVGFVTQQRSKRAAERAAVKRCKEIGGGDDCKIAMSYSNGCGVVAEPAETMPDMIGVYEWGGTIEEAAEKALPICSAGSGGRACKVVHSACTKPYWVYD